jgi:hypothetical protein
LKTTQKVPVAYKIAPHFTRKNELIFAGAKVVFEKDKIGAGCLQGHIGILRQPGTLVLISCVKTVHEKNKSMKFQGYRHLFFSSRGHVPWNTPAIGDCFEVSDFGHPDFGVKPQEK